MEEKLAEERSKRLQAEKAKEETRQEMQKEEKARTAAEREAERARSDVASTAPAIRSLEERVRRGARENSELNRKLEDARVRMRGLQAGQKRAEELAAEADRKDKVNIRRRSRGEL